MTGVRGYGRLDGVWWYNRDSSSGVTTVFVSPDLFPPSTFSATPPPGG